MGPDDFKVIEANFLAKTYINNGLSPKDRCKVSNLKTAKEMWKALDQIHNGSTDLKETLIITKKRDFHTFNMIEGETISSYQSRLETLNTRLISLGIREHQIYPLGPR